MRPARIIATVIFAAAIAVTGCTTHSTAVHPTAAPAPPVTAPPDTVVAAPTPKQPTRPVLRVPGPVLANGRYDAYIRTVDPSRNRLVVDLVQVFDGQAAVDAAIADGIAGDQAQVLGVYVRNQNPRLRTLPLAGDLRLDLRGGDCEAPRNHQLAKLATDARAMSGSVHTYYFTLTVRGGSVHQVQEFLAIDAC
jgi:hypothetical protein